MRWLRRLSDRLFPPAPAEIRDALVRFQYQAVRRQIPALHLTALVNIGIVMGVLWHTGSPPAHYAWMPLVGAFNLYRMLLWKAQSEVTPPDAARFLRNSTIAAFISVGSISLYSAATFALGLFPYPVLIPISFAFASFSIAHGLASMRTTAACVILIGIFPSAGVMIASGDFLSFCLAVSAASVGLLQLRFIEEHQRHILATITLQQEVEQLANRDSLTGLLNRRAFLAAYERTARDGGHALLVLDLDHFKTINDRFGHDAGDRVLFQFAAIIATACADTDLAGRFGGEEFVVLARSDDPVGFAERLGHAVAAHDFSTPGCPIGHVTVSIGVDPVDAATRFDAAFARADAALYAAKADGRNCVRRAA